MPASHLRAAYLLYRDLLLLGTVIVYTWLPSFATSSASCRHTALDTACSRIERHGKASTFTVLLQLSAKEVIWMHTLTGSYQGWRVVQDPYMLPSPEKLKRSLFSWVLRLP